MGRVCRICYRERPHEHFGGRGERAYVCKTCRKLPKEERERILLTDELYGFLEQSNISKKNIARLKGVENAGIESVARLANLIRRIAEVKPHKRKRGSFLRNHHHDLFQFAVEVGIYEAFEPVDEEEWVLGFDDGIYEESLPQWACEETPPTTVSPSDEPRRQRQQDLPF